MKQLTLGNESIAFQTGDFFKDLIKLITDIRDSGARTEQDFAKHMIAIDKCIFDHTGITCSSQPIPDYENAFVILPMMTKGNVLSRPDFRKFQQKHWDADTISFLNVEKKGWIDPANSRVGGAFSEIVFRTYVGTYYFTDKRSTVEECAATIIHELGHAYTFIQFIADTLIVNNVLQRSYQELIDGKPDKKIKIILTKAADDMCIKNRDWLEAVNDETDEAVAFRLLVTAVQIEERKMDNKRYFTINAAEELADIFAARHGAGRAIVSMRSKRISMPRQSYDIMQNVAWTIFWAVFIPFSPLGGGLLASVGALATILGFSRAGSEMDITKFKQEAQKMRNQFVENIKVGKLPKDQIAAIIDNINFTDKTIQSYQGSIDQPAVVKFMDMFRRGKMDARASREYTDKLEVLVANDLFIRAAQFGTR